MGPAVDEAFDALIVGSTRDGTVNDIVVDMWPRRRRHSTVRPTSDLSLFAQVSTLYLT